LSPGTRSCAGRRDRPVIRNVIEFNEPFAKFYGLEVGSKWTDSWIEIIHTKLEMKINLVAVGMTGQIRGINLDSYRPDFLIADDPDDEETTGTELQIRKTDQRYFGALSKSMASPGEAPHAKQILLQTPLADKDLISKACADPSVKVIEISCFDDEQMSTWEKAFPTKYLRKEKQRHIDKGILPIWLSEMEVKLVTDENSKFKLEWFKKTSWDRLPPKLRCFLWIDPVPPPSDRELANNLEDKDYEAFCVVGHYAGKLYGIEARAMRGHDPSWTLKTFWELMDRWNIVKAGVESINYQRTLKWLIEKSMQERRRYVEIVDKYGHGLDRRKKAYRIVDGIKDPAVNGQVYLCDELPPELLTQLARYSNVEHDDLIETFAGAMRLARDDMTLFADDGDEEDDEIGQTYDGIFRREYAGALGHAP
jgi:hypothetical protein